MGASVQLLRPDNPSILLIGLLFHIYTCATTQIWYSSMRRGSYNRVMHFIFLCEISSTNWISMDWLDALRQAVCVKMKVAAVQLVTRKAPQRQQKRVCDSTGWPEGAKAMHVERVYHFFYFEKISSFSSKYISTFSRNVEYSYSRFTGSVVGATHITE